VRNADIMAEIIGNKAIESAALEWVLDLERAAGRQPVDARFTGAPGDIASPPRVIELKAFGKSARGNDLWLETRQLEEARNNPNFYLYIAENIRQGDRAQFTLRVLGGERLHALLRRAKEQHYYTVPWPVAQYDSCPFGLDG